MKSDSCPSEKEQYGSQVRPECPQSEAMALRLSAVGRGKMSVKPSLKQKNSGKRTVSSASGNNTLTGQNYRLKLESLARIPGGMSQNILQTSTTDRSPGLSQQVVKGGASFLSITEQEEDSPSAPNTGLVSHSCVILAWLSHCSGHLGSGFMSTFHHL